MRLRAGLLLLVVVGLAVPAAAEDLAASLLGHWILDKQAAIEAFAPPYYKAATPERQKEILDDMMKRVPDVTVEFTASTAVIRSGQKPPLVTVYKVMRTDKNVVWLADPVPQVEDEPAPTEQYSMEFVDADTVKFLKEGVPPLLLKRRK